MSKHVGEKCEKRADGDPDGRRVGRMETWTDITIPSYVQSEDGRLKNQGGDCETYLCIPKFCRNSETRSIGHVSDVW